MRRWESNALDHSASNWPTLKPHIIFIQIYSLANHIHLSYVFDDYEIVRSLWKYFSIRFDNQIISSREFVIHKERHPKKSIQFIFLLEWIRFRVFRWISLIFYYYDKCIFTPHKRKIFLRKIISLLKTS